MALASGGQRHTGMQQQPAILLGLVVLFASAMVLRASASTGVRVRSWPEIPEMIASRSRAMPPKIASRSFATSRRVISRWAATSREMLCVRRSAVLSACCPST